MHDLRTRQLIFGVIAGALAGLISGALITALNGPPAISLLGGGATIAAAWGLHLMVSVVLGFTYAALFTRVELGYSENMLSAVTFALLGWVLFMLVLIPLVMGQGGQWQASQAAEKFPALIAYLFQGALLGAIYHTMHRLANRTIGVIEVDEAAAEPEPVRQRIVILGGGFAGVEAAQHLEKLFERDPGVAITLVSETNHLLFTPMLSEVTAGGVEAQHISPALRAFFRKVRVVHGKATQVDYANKTVHLASDASATRTHPFDHLVIAVGVVPNFFGNNNIEANTLTFKSLRDAMLIRNHIIETLEAADIEPDPDRRRAMLRFVVVGGGYAGVELIGGMNDFIRGSLYSFPNIPADEVEIILIHTRDRILPELGEDLACYAQEKMEARGVTFRLNTRVTDAAPGQAILGDEIIETDTLIWTAGNKPNPLLAALPFEHDERGRLLTDATMAVKGASNVWAIGDNAAIPDVIDGGTYPPTAQHAVREARQVAHNIHAAITGAETGEFRFRNLGQLAVVGHQTAVAEVMGIQFSGLLAWIMWRTIYLSKLPTLEKKIRVLIDWNVDLFFPRDLGYFQLSAAEDKLRAADAHTATPQEAVADERTIS